MNLRKKYRPKLLTRPAAPLMFSRMFQIIVSQPSCDRSSSCSCDSFPAPVDARMPPAFWYCSRWLVSPFPRLLWKLLLEAAVFKPQLRVPAPSEGSCTPNLLLLLAPGARIQRRRRSWAFAPDLFGPMLLLKPDFVKAVVLPIPLLSVWSVLPIGQWTAWMSKFNPVKTKSHPDAGRYTTQGVNHAS